MKSFYVNSKELFDKKKNPKMSLSVKDILGNRKITKHYIKGVCVSKKRDDKMDIKKPIEICLDNLGTVNKNAVSISRNGKNVNLYFSYKTLVAVDNIVSENDWSKTTGKLINYLQPNKKLRVPHQKVLEESQKRLTAVLDS